jgi:hypothetical protein
MAYNDFTLESVEINLGLPIHSGALFSTVPVIVVPDWLPAQLARGRALALNSEKAKSEFIVAPILLGVRELSGNQISILSGQRLDVDASRNLQGECDFLLSLNEPLPRLRAPRIAILEAKKGDIDGALGQCAAQMFAARLFNEKSGDKIHPVFGCVTNSDVWQFLLLDEKGITIDLNRLYLFQLREILATILAAIELSKT